jgi:AcrR family transcriptional regulator
VTTRAEKALANRRRMVRAAYDRFCENGYTGTTIADVAADAGVAVPTVYYTFKTKAALLGEALGAAIVGFDLWREPPPEFDTDTLLPWHTWWEDFLAAPTSAAALEICLANGVEILRRVAPLWPAVQGSLGDPESAAHVAASLQGRYDSYTEFVNVIADKPPGLKKGVSRRTAADIMDALFGGDVYRNLADRGWSHARISRFLQHLLAGELLG